jgi:hypothetical protein
MSDGKYLYCILEGGQHHRFVETGLFGKQPYTVSYKDISAVVSNVPFKEMQPDVKVITSHQKIIEDSRTRGTTLPARFGIMFKSDDSVKKMLTKTYKELKSKMVNLKGKDEFGLKIMIDKPDLNRLKLVSQNNPEIKKIKKEIASSGKGTAYFLKMKMDEAVRNETYKRIDHLSGQIHRELATDAQQSCLLKTDFDQIILNAAYLVNRDDVIKFRKKMDNLKERYEKDGLIFHMSGPWAPYSFC